MQTVQYVHILHRTVLLRRAPPKGQLKAHLWCAFSRHSGVLLRGRSGVPPSLVYLTLASAAGLRSEGLGKESHGAAPLVVQATGYRPLALVFCGPGLHCAEEAKRRKTTAGGVLLLSLKLVNLLGKPPLRCLHTQNGIPLLDFPC